MHITEKGETEIPDSSRCLRADTATCHHHKPFIKSLGTLANNHSVIPESEAAATKTEKLEMLNNELNNPKYVLSAPYIM